MIVLADSGSSKTEWVFVDQGVVRTVLTDGINPMHMPAAEIEKVLNAGLSPAAERTDAVYFYGSGCIPAQYSVLNGLLMRFFQTDRVVVESDLLGAARGLLAKKAGIICILGTGSNSAFYDGQQIVQNTPPLGYILGDEGSGSDLGKRFIGDLLKGLLPQELTELFYREYPLQYTEILESVYRKPGANRFLSRFSPFLQAQMHHPSIRTRIEQGFSEFIERNLLRYEPIRTLPVCCTGSVAYFFRPVLEEVLRRHGLCVGKIERTPMQGLIRYHGDSKI
ncbi:MAG: ATPase [Rikenellaceae bacterium]|nr:ATPase [Rikenellaceae bacterium]